MKKILITQSNYIPWKGYFDSIACCDVFVIYDDMQYTKEDWRNRNKIKTNDGLKWLTIPVKTSGKYFQKIKDTKIADKNWNIDHWNRIKEYYRKANCFNEMADWIEPLYRNCEFEYLSEINFHFIKAINSFMGIETEIRFSSEFELHEERSQRLINICKELGGTDFYAGPAAKNYIDTKKFEKKDIQLHWLDYSGYKEYTQLYPPFKHGVSILDLILNMGEESRNYLKYIKLMHIQKLQWDSDFFGYPVGKLVIFKQQKFNYEAFVKEAQEFKLVYVFAHEKLENDALNLVDTKVILSQELTEDNSILSSEKNIKSFNEADHDFEQLKNLALLSGVYSRFNNDINFKENEYSKLYERWIEVLAKRGRAFDIIVYYEDNTIFGFATVEEKTPELADIGLVAVDELARGKGIGTKLIENAKHRAYQKGFKAIQVVTQSANTNAVKLYMRCNFKIENQKFIYHYWNK